MTQIAKAKAIDLIEKLQPYVDYIECEIFTERQNMLKNAKTCATIIVDEIIQNNYELLDGMKYHEELNFWEAVKLEIEIYRE